MILCLDVGNSQIFGGVFVEGKLKLTFRHNSCPPCSSDQFGIFLKNVLRENNLATDGIDSIAICSVVPALDYSLRAACIKYFDIEPFILQAGAKTGLKIKYRNPLEVGADRIATAVAATHQFPSKPLLIVDFGTATTLCAISKDKSYLGGVIMPGMKLAMSSLEQQTAKLSAVEILKPNNLVGRSTAESTQIGIYYSQFATIKELKTQISQQFFPDDNVIVLGTGGFSHLFQNADIFTAIIPDLVLHGLHQLIALNTPKKETQYAYE